MASFYNRDAFSDLMEQLRIQGTPMVEGGRGKSSVGTQFAPSGGGSTDTTQVQQLDIPSDSTSASQQAAMDAFQSSPFTTGLTPDVVMANYNLRNAGIINRGTNVLPSSRPLYTTSTGGISTGATPTSTGAATGTNQITVTGQSGAGTTLGAGAITPVSSMGAGDIEQITTTAKRPEDEAILSGVTSTTGALPTGDIAGEVFADLPTDREKNQNTFVDTAVNALSTVTGLPLGDIYEVVTTAERPKEVLDAALGALGITIPDFDFGTAGETFEVRPENLLPGYFDPTVTDMSGMNDTTTAGTGGAFDIANLAAIRSVVPGTYDPNRRAGSGGQRYFSDVQYAPQGGIAGSQAAANAQAMMLAYQNAMNPAYQVRPGATVDRATSMAQRAAGLAGLLPSTVTGTIPTARTAATTPAATTPADTTDTTAFGTATGDAQSPYGWNTEQIFSLFSQGLAPGDIVSRDPRFGAAQPGTMAYDSLVKDYEYWQENVANTPAATTENIFSGIDATDGFSKQEQDTIAELLSSNKANIGDVAQQFDVGGMDVVEGLLRGGYETPAQMVERLAPMNEGLTEVDLIANLLNTGRAQPEEIASYYRNTDPEQFANLTAQDVEAELAKINQQSTLDYLAGLSDEEVGNLINEDKLSVAQAVELYQDRYPGLTEADVEAALKAQGFAQGGDVNGFYLGGTTDGMADQIPATINNMQPAALSDGEFVIPADVVSHLGNGNSDAGAKELYSMMDRIRKDRTGTTKQGRQIDPNKYLA